MIGILLSVEQVALQLNRKPSTIRRWILRGKLAAAKSKGRYLILEEEVSKVKTLTRPLAEQHQDREDSLDRIAQMQSIIREAFVTQDDIATQRNIDLQTEESRVKLHDR